MSSYLLAGGGTAGHVNPMLAIADEIVRREPNARIVMVGTKEGLESRLVPERGFDLHTIARLPFPRRPDARAWRFLRGWAKAVQDVQDLIADRRVDVVIGVGGYAAAPAYAAARKSGVPIVVHEANAKPGLANRWAARSTPFVGVAFEGTRLPHARYVGMPLRREIAELEVKAVRNSARESFGLKVDHPVVLVTGGSLGAQNLNRAIVDALPAFLRAGIQVLHITGEKKQSPTVDSPGYVTLPYCDHMDLALASADLVVSRAGASAVSEIMALGIPAVFVPYAVGNGEQSLNARMSVEVGGALVVADAEFDGEWLTHHVIPTLSSSRTLAKMARAMTKVGTRRGSELTVNLVEEALASRGTSAP